MPLQLLVCGAQKVRTFFTKLRRNSSAGEEASRSASYVRERKLSSGFSYKWERKNIARQNKTKLIFRLRDEKSAVKTLWPVACREFLFLPEYKVQHGSIEQNFEIVKFIAKGAFGSVYKVRKLTDSKTFALKVLEKSKVSKWAGNQQKINWRFFR